MIKTLIYTIVIVLASYACYIVCCISSDENRYTCYGNEVIVSNGNIFELCYDKMYSMDLFRNFIPEDDNAIEEYYQIRKNGHSIFKFERASCLQECGSCSYYIKLDTVTTKYIFLIDSNLLCFRIPNKDSISVDDIQVYLYAYYKASFVKHYYQVRKDSFNLKNISYDIDSLDFGGIPDYFKFDGYRHCFRDWHPWF